MMITRSEEQRIGEVTVGGRKAITGLVNWILFFVRLKSCFAKELGT